MMCDLTEFASLPLDQLMREIECMKAVRIAKHYPSLSPLTVAHDCHAESLTRATVSTYSEKSHEPF